MSSLLLIVDVYVVMMVFLLSDCTTYNVQTARCGNFQSVVNFAIASTVVASSTVVSFGVSELSKFCIHFIILFVTITVI